ncbi:MAG: urease accessory protein UreD [Thermoproteota archaeon]|nr:urease accessory protein UreD [Thermoproteota archaeon]
MLKPEKGMEAAASADLKHFTPKSVPPEILAYSSDLAQLGVGKAGKLGALVLRLEQDKSNGKTSVKEQYSRVPLYTQRALYLEEALSNMAYMYIISPSGGILQGDRYRMDITLRNHAFAHITTQGATRIYRMEKNYATQIINIDVGEDCYFEYIPDQVIPYRDSRFYQEANLTVHDSATLLYSEIITPGRVASGEHFDYDICYMKATAKDHNGRLKFTDVAMLEPKKRDMNVFGVLSNHDVVANMYIITKNKKLQEINMGVNAALKAVPKVYAGASILPSNCGVGIRMLGNTASELRNVIYEIIRVVRKIVLDAPFSGIRKG